MQTQKAIIVCPTPGQRNTLTSISLLWRSPLFFLTGTRRRCDIRHQQARKYKPTCNDDVNGTYLGNKTDVPAIIRGTFTFLAFSSRSSLTVTWHAQTNLDGQTQVRSVHEPRLELHNIWRLHDIRFWCPHQKSREHCTITKPNNIKVRKRWNHKTEPRMCVLVFTYVQRIHSRLFVYRHYLCRAYWNCRDRNDGHRLILLVSYGGPLPF